MISAQRRTSGSTRRGRFIRRWNKRHQRSNGIHGRILGRLRASRPLPLAVINGRFDRTIVAIVSRLIVIVTLRGVVTVAG